MAIDWASEPYVRLFKRETDDDLLLSWEARAVWHEFLKKADRCGLLETRRGMKGLAALIRIPLEVTERAMPELLEDGRLRAVQTGFIAPNYLEANDTPRSDRARQADSRFNRKNKALQGAHPGDGVGSESRDVTLSHAESQSVTHIRSDTVTDQIIGPASGKPVSAGLADLIRKVDAIADEKPAKESRAKNRARLSESWEPREEERALASKLGLDLDHETQEFKTYWLGDGRPKADWNRTFANRLLQQSKRGTRWGGPAQSQQRNIPEL